MPKKLQENDRNTKKKLQIYKICKKKSKESLKNKKKNHKRIQKLQKNYKIKENPKTEHVYIHRIDKSVVFCDLNLLLVFCGLTLYILYHSEQGTIDNFSILLIREYLIKCHHN